MYTCIRMHFLAILRALSRSVALPRSTLTGVREERGIKIAKSKKKNEIEYPFRFTIPYIRLSREAVELDTSDGHLWFTVTVLSDCCAGGTRGRSAAQSLTCRVADFVT